MFSSPKIRNITVSGRVASGATTLSKKLAEALDWNLINGGEIYRDYAREKGIPLEQTGLSSDEYHRVLDQFIKEKLQNEKHLIIESWLSGFDAQEIPDVFKVFVACPNDAIRVDRLVNREGLTIEEAKHHIKTREAENLKKWGALYNTRDIWNPKLYDLVVDTYTNGPTETLNLVLKAIGYHDESQK